MLLHLSLHVCPIIFMDELLEEYFWVRVYAETHANLLFYLPIRVPLSHVFTHPGYYLFLISTSSMLILISSVTGDVEHLFMGVLAIYSSMDFQCNKYF